MSLDFCLSFHVFFFAFPTVIMTFISGIPFSLKLWTYFLLIFQHFFFCCVLFVVISLPLSIFLLLFVFFHSHSLSRSVFVISPYRDMSPFQWQPLCLHSSARSLVFLTVTTTPLRYLKGEYLSLRRTRQEKNKKSSSPWRVSGHSKICPHSDVETNALPVIYTLQ